MKLKDLENKRLFTYAGKKYKKITNFHDDNKYMIICFNYGLNVYEIFDDTNINPIVMLSSLGPKDKFILNDQEYTVIDLNERFIPEDLNLDFIKFVLSDSFSVCYLTINQEVELVC